jgi:hypothetical protein
VDVVLTYLNPVLLDGVLQLGLSTGRDHLRKRGRLILQPRQQTTLCHLTTNPGPWQRHGLRRQSLSIFLATWLSSTLFYLLFGTVCYHLRFDQSLEKHPKFRRH